MDRQDPRANLSPKLDPAVAEAPPWSEALTDYDRDHLVTYLRLLDADQAGADWREAAQQLLGRDPAAQPEAARACWQAHLSRARWMTATGYRHLLAPAAP